MIQTTGAHQELGCRAKENENKRAHTHKYTYTYNAQPAAQRTHILAGIFRSCQSVGLGSGTYASAFVFAARPALRCAPCV